MKKLIILATILFSVVVTAQAPQGFNYQATARNASGELLLNTTIAIRFQLHETTITGPVIYTEAHSVTTNAYGHFTAIVGQGNTTDTFSTISWSTNSHFLEVSLFDISVPGYVNLGTLQLLSVPYALNAKTANNVFSGDYNDLTNQPTNIIANGLEALNEGSGTGWRLIGRDPNNYGAIGSNAVDLSLTQDGRGATGPFSFALGIDTTASGNTSVTMGNATMASGYLAVAMGQETNADAYASLAIGKNNIGGGLSNDWEESDPVFEIGIGQNDENRANALTVLKRGVILAPSFNIDDIQEDKALITKEYADLNFVNSGLEAIDEGDGIGWRLIGRNPNGPIGYNAIDLSLSDGFSNTFGATGRYSIAVGLSTTAFGENTMAMGIGTVASGYGAVAMGFETNANAYTSVALGRYNIGGAEDSDNWLSTDPLFEIGIGTDDTSRANALTILKNGIITAPGFDLNEITDAKALITKEYADANFTNTSSTGLITLDEGNGLGRRLAGVNPIYYGNIGLNAIDLSYSDAGGTHGATGRNSIAMGEATTASGISSTAMGEATTSTGDFSTATGKSTNATGESTVAMGEETNANAQLSVVMGRYNVGGGTPQNWVDTESVFEIGIGVSHSNKANALTVLKNGTVTAPSFDLNEITDAKALITKEYIDTNVISAFGLKSLDEGNGIGWRLTGRDPSNYGDIGLNAIDLSFSESNSGNNGAIGINATTMGINTQALGYNSIAMGEFSAAIGDGSFAAGHSTQAIGKFSVAMGLSCKATSYNSFVIGSKNIGGGTTNAWISNEPLFEIGNGITSTSNAFTVYKNGNAYLNGTLTQASDLRLKKDIKPLNNSLEKMTQLHGKHYYWNDTKPHSDDLQIGLIAQEVELIFPELVHTANDGYKSVNYTSLIPVLIEAIKEQQNEIEALKNQNKTLQQDTAKMDALDKKNASLEKRMQKIELLLSLASKE